MYLIPHFISHAFRAIAKHADDSANLQSLQVAANLSLVSCDRMGHISSGLSKTCFPYDCFSMDLGQLSLQVNSKLLDSFDVVPKHRVSGQSRLVSSCLVSLDIFCSCLCRSRLRFQGCAILVSVLSGNRRGKVCDAFHAFHFNAIRKVRENVSATYRMHFGVCVGCVWGVCVGVCVGCDIFVRQRLYCKAVALLAAILNGGRQRRLVREPFRMWLDGTRVASVWWRERRVVESNRQRGVNIFVGVTRAALVKTKLSALDTLRRSALIKSAEIEKTRYLAEYSNEKERSLALAEEKTRALETRLETETDRLNQILQREKELLLTKFQNDKLQLETQTNQEKQQAIREAHAFLQRNKDVHTRRHTHTHTPTSTHTPPHTPTSTHTHPPTTHESLTEIDLIPSVFIGR